MRRAPRAFLEVADALCANSGRERTSAIVYSVGWTQHTVGVQYIRTAAILQLLLGNIGRPGGGILALRGHASIQGSTDIPTLYNILPGYLPILPPARRHQSPTHQSPTHQSSSHRLSLPRTRRRDPDRRVHGRRPHGGGRHRGRGPIVAEMTGYPPELLDLDLDREPTVDMVSRPRRSRRCASGSAPSATSPFRCGSSRPWPMRIGWVLDKTSATPTVPVEIAASPNAVLPTQGTLRPGCDAGQARRRPGGGDRGGARSWLR